MPVKKRYNVNNSNNLVVKDRKLSHILHGNFCIDRDNKLIYRLNEPPAWRRKYSSAGRIKFEGNWKINRNYDLVLGLTDETKAGIRDELILKGNIVAVEAGALVFEIKAKDINGNTHFRILKLNGFWQADEYNRLCFLVTQKNDPPEIITFSGIWQVNRNQQISYTYEKTDLATKEKRIHTISFEGFWQISEANRLKYILSHSTKSVFDFRAQIETPNLYPQQGKIKYRLGVGYSRHKDVNKNVVTLYGAWKFSRKAGISFEMDYGRAGLDSIEFNLERCLTDKDKIAIGLSNKKSEPLGIVVTFTRRLFKALDGEAYFKLKKKGSEAGAEAGFRTMF